ncbi:tetratricopeptide repeat protein [Noviherbaspirillum sp. 1P10PC]|uniref:nuclear transport factor 2 family protein n=1 Tax=Noviherbaspirillum sp. 1P10PC TaxID=3132292 RepID=UPI0039A0A89C
MSRKLSVRRFWRNCLSPGATFLLCSALVASASAAPAEAQLKIAELMQRGQLDAAMMQVDEALLANPRHPQMRFNKGVILAQQGKSAEAITLLLKLTEDYPRLSEPYNNLAVLYAAGGQYESARIALNKAVANNPDYGMAHENLGDVYAGLASQAYEKAAKLDGNANARAKAAALRGTVQSASGIAKLATPSEKNAPAMAERTAAAPKPVLGKEAVSRGIVAEHGDAEQAAVLEAVNAWANAWSARDVSAYLAAYSKDFVTPRGLSHEKWAAERAERITNKQRISVKVVDPKVTLKGGQATVQFKQQFSSDKLRSTDQKTLTLIRLDGAWRIRQERVG